LPLEAPGHFPGDRHAVRVADVECPMLRAAEGEGVDAHLPGAEGGEGGA
jgi:hypothetical protein